MAWSLRGAHSLEPSKHRACKEGRVGRRLDPGLPNHLDASQLQAEVNSWSCFHNRNHIPQHERDLLRTSSPEYLQLALHAAAQQKQDLREADTRIISCTRSYNDCTHCRGRAAAFTSTRSWFWIFNRCGHRARADV